MAEQTLAQRIKAKYPEYADMPDADLEQKVLAKYPEYGDMPRTQTQPQQSPLDQMNAMLSQRGLPPVKQPGQAVPQGLQGKPTFSDRLLASDNPGVSEGANLAEALGGYVKAGPGEAIGGIVDAARGNVSRGIHRSIAGAGTTLAPTLPLTAPAAPLATAIGMAGGAAGARVASSGATALGASPEQAEVAGDIGGIAGGYGASLLQGAVRGAISRGLLLGRTPTGAYESALKPSTTMSPGDRAAVVNTGLQEGIPVSKGGMEKLSALIDDLNSRISDVINRHPEVEIDPSAVATRVAGTRARAASQVNPESDVAAIDAAKAEFLRKHTAEAPYTQIEFRPVDGGPVGAVPVGSGVSKTVEPIPAPAAQAEKVGTYRALGDKAYGELQSASVEAQKALARGLKEELAQAFPEIGPMNAREGRALDLQDVLERAVARNANHQLIGIGTPVTAGAAKALTGSNKAAAVAGTLKAVLDSPEVKSRLAIALVRSGLTPDVAFRRIGSYSAALAAASARAASEPPDMSQSQAER
jgi:hypothetical protein